MWGAYKSDIIITGALWKRMPLLEKHQKFACWECRIRGHLPVGNVDIMKFTCWECGIRRHFKSGRLTIKNLLGLNWKWAFEKELSSGKEDRV